VENMPMFWGRINTFLKNVDVIETLCMGHCFMMDGEVIRRAGMFDENFKVGYWEDVDYFDRCDHEGVKRSVCQEAFIHHLGCSTFTKSVNRTEINYHDENRDFLIGKRKRFYRDIQIDIDGGSTGIEETPFDISKSRFLGARIDPSKATVGGNVLCISNISGDPLYYIWMDLDGDGVRMRHGYLSNGGWVSKHIHSQSHRGIVSVSIVEGRHVVIGTGSDDIVVGESSFVSVGDARGKTDNSNANVEITEMR